MKYKIYIMKERILNVKHDVVGMVQHQTWYLSSTKSQIKYIKIYNINKWLYILRISVHDVFSKSRETIRNNFSLEQGDQLWQVLKNNKK